MWSKKLKRIRSMSLQAQTYFYFVLLWLENCFILHINWLVYTSLVANDVIAFFILDFFFFKVFCELLLTFFKTFFCFFQQVRYTQKLKCSLSCQTWYSHEISFGIRIIAFLRLVYYYQLPFVVKFFSGRLCDYVICSV